MDDDSSDSGSAQPSSSAQPKRRRLHGACDTCRRKKVKCDSAKMPMNFCSNCKAANIECTHNIPRQSRKDTQKSYIRALEERLDKMEKMLHTIRPDGDLGPFSASSPESMGVTRSSSVPSAPSPASPPNVMTNVTYPVPQSIAKTASPTGSPSRSNPSSDSEDLAHIDLAEHFRHMSFEAMEDRFFGRSSAFMFAKVATNLKTQKTGKNPEVRRYYGRPQYWEAREWEQKFVEDQKFQFVYPDRDLLDNLVNIYFTKFHTLIPIFHRPTFMGSLASGLHYRDYGFGMTVLLVCAVASRQCEDSRVWLEEDKTELSSGWKYFCQVPLIRNSLINRASIYDVQYYCLAVQYLLGTSFPHLAWNILGLGIRVAQERGAHRRKGPTHRLTLLDELWKRAFWCLLMHDRIMCSFLGRPMSIQEEDIDCEYPVECDDEYWDLNDPEHPFKQPPGKPSLVTAFNCQLKLCEMFSFVLRTLYSTKRSKVLTGFVGDQWEQRVVTELDSAMNQWKDNLPDHLRWDPNNPDPTFYQQSLMLHTSFYYLQIQVHRPFLLKRSPLSFPSLAFCTNAARSCSHVLEGAIKRDFWPSSPLFMSAFASGLVLLLNIWGSKHSGVVRDPAREMEDVHKCMHVLQLCERRWHIPARLWDILNELSSLRDVSLPAPPLSNNKRRRGSSARRSSSQQAASSLHPFDEVQPVQASAVLEATTSATVDAIPVATTTATAGDQWEFNNFLLSQIGLPMVPFPSTSSVEEEYHDTAAQGSYSQYSGFQPSVLPTTYTDAEVSSSMTTSTTYPMSLWEDAPHGFNYEEWDSFIANIGDMNRLMGNGSPDVSSNASRM